jgi:transcriptional regulator with XRE-family HTH domain
LASAGLTTGDLARDLGVDPKTVERWISPGRTPHPGNCYEVARLVNASPTWLWPELAKERTPEASRAEVVELYPHRFNAPKTLWEEVAGAATDHIDILAYASLFFTEDNPQVIPILQRKAEDGTKVRIVLGDPDSAEVALRGDEEGLGESIAGRIRMALAYYRPLGLVPGVSIHLHRTTLYNSILRFDDQMLINMHVYGAYGYIAPLLHLRRVENGEMFDMYETSFEKVWAKSWPMEQ